MDVCEDQTSSSSGYTSYLPQLLAEFARFLSNTQLLADQPDLLTRVADLLTESIEEIRDFEAKKNKYNLSFVFSLFFFLPETSLLFCYFCHQRVEGLARDQKGPL